MEENTNLTPEQVVEKVGNMFDEKMQNVPTTDDVKALKDELDSLKSLDLEAKNNDIEKSIAKFEGKLEALNEKAVTVKEETPKTLAGKVFKLLTDNIDAVKSAINAGGQATLSLKDTTITNNYVGEYALTDFDSDIDREVRQRYGILDAVNRRTTTSKFITYVTQTGTSTMKYLGEAGDKIEGEPSWEEITEEVKKIAGFVKVSKEMLEDLSFIRAEINNDLMLTLRQEIESSLLNGGGGVVVNGLLSNGAGLMNLPVFNAGPFAGAVAGANISDVIRVAKAQVERANFDPTHIIMHPDDIASMQLTKGTDNTYTYPMYLPNGTEVMNVAGIRIISSTYIAQDQYILGDMSKVNVAFRNDMALTVGLDKDDFTRNMVTMLVEARLCQYVKTNQKNAFVVGTFSADIASITPTP